MGQRELGESQESGGGATPLVDATVKLLEEFVYEEKKPLPTQQQGSRSKAKEEDEKKEDKGVDSFMPTFVYDAMKEKKRFEHMRVCSNVFLTRYVLLLIMSETYIGWPSRRCRGILRLLP